MITITYNQVRLNYIVYEHQTHRLTDSQTHRLNAHSDSNAQAYELKK